MKTIAQEINLDQVISPGMPRIVSLVILVRDIDPSFFFKLRPSSSRNTSFRLSVHPSVTPFSLCSHHRVIMDFSGVITNDRSDIRANGQGQRSKVKITEFKT